MFAERPALHQALDMRDPGHSGRSGCARAQWVLRKSAVNIPAALLQVGTVRGTLVGLVFGESPGLQRRKQEDVLLQPRPERERDEFTGIPQTLEG